ncbi:MAG: RluA family pseudouridine synthase [Phycisphaerales bacterium]|nr:RluA family pseudouridine synthase [Phycisphaerales bacterium]
MSESAAPDDGEEVVGTDPAELFDRYERQREADDEAPITAHFEVLRSQDTRLDRFLARRVPFLSRTQLQRLIEEDAVTVNGRVPKASTRLRRGDTVVATLPPPPSNAIDAEEIPIHVLHEDDHLIVISKQPDLIVHPARAHKSGTLINALSWHFLHRSGGTLSSVGEEIARPGVVHRLDKHTSGVMVCAKSDVAHWRLAKQFELRRTEKRYVCLVHGEVEPEADLIDLPLGKHPTIREKYAVRHDEHGKPSQTVYRVREVYEGYSLVEVELRTGRTHQIRVHMSHVGYPLVGDDLYAGRHVTVGDLDPSQPDAADTLLDRQALHAARLGFHHPVSGERVSFEAPLWPDLARAVELLRRTRLKRVLAAPGAVLEIGARNACP